MGAPLSYEEQHSRFMENLDEAWCLLDDLIHNESEAIELEALKRHNEGFRQYGDRMYGWSSEERYQNVIEELSDALCYLTSGGIA